MIQSIVTVKEWGDIDEGRVLAELLQCFVLRKVLEKEPLIAGPSSAA